MPPGLKRIGVILAHPRHYIGQAIFEALQAVPCEPIALPMNAARPADVDCYLIYGPAVSLGQFVEQLTDLNAPKPNVIVWLTEQTPSPDGPAPAQRLLADLAWSGYWSMYGLRKISPARFPKRLFRVLDTRSTRFRMLGALRRLQREGQLRLLAVFAPSHQRFFARMDVPAQVVPFGHHPNFGAPLRLERDIDVVFLGSLRDRRRLRIVGSLQNELHRRNIRLVIKDGSRERGYAYGDERTHLLNRAKVMLNIMRQPWDDLVFRMLLAAPNGALLVSEPVVDSEPFAPGRHFVMAELAQLADTIEHYLRRPDEREAIAHCARDYVLNRLTMPAMARRLLGAAGIIEHNAQIDC